MSVIRLPKDELDAQIFRYLQEANYSEAANAMKDANPSVTVAARKLKFSALIAATKNVRSDSDSDDEPVRKPVKASPKTAPKKPVVDSDSDDEPVCKPVKASPKTAPKKPVVDSDSDDE
ncbi:uncharacterized protein TM35_000042360, partial [Trypanosoma theileri]